MAGSHNCTACPAGYECTATDAASVIACQPGYYSLAGATACTQCPAGQACPNTMTGPSGSCNPGEYSEAGASLCTTCPAGYECPSISTRGTPCAYGSFALAGSLSCTPCPAGKSCAGSTTSAQADCPAGWYSQVGDGFCTACPAGSYCVDATSTPTTCPAGSYSPGKMTACITCPAGQYCPAGATAPTICPLGSYCPSGASSPTTCSDGFYCSVGTASDSNPHQRCPIGGYCTAGTFTACPAGTYSTQYGSTSSATCVTCEAGYYCPLGATYYTKRLCEAGRYCPANSATPTLCPAGTYSPNPGSINAGACVQCTAGRVCPAGSESDDANCATGHYCPAGTGVANANPCPAGRYGGTGRVNLVSASDCLPCPPGEYCVAGSVTGTVCPLGTYRASSGAGALTDCTQCPAGSLCIGTGLVGIPDDCPAGHYCPAGETVSATPCDDGTYTDRNDAASQSDCLPCPPGKSCASPTGGSIRPQTCKAGYYCPGNSGDKTVALNLHSLTGTCSPSSGSPYLCPCPAGRYSASDALTAALECTLCPPGEFCVGASAATSGICPAGYYCPDGTQFSTQYPCPAGTYSTSTQLTHAEQCTACPTSQYCTGGPAAPVDCPAGTYANRTRTAAVGECIQCPSGYECIAGTEQPVPCGVGRYSAPGAGSCTTCAAGTYCSSNTTSAAAAGAQLCPAGTLCGAGQSKFPELTTEPCPAGFYCPVGTVTPTACPAGTYNPHEGGASAAACTACPAGKYCAGTNNIAPTGVCAAGHYCPASSSSATEVPCAVGFYRTLTGGRAAADCGLCPSGSYCPSAGTVVPTVCPTGHYCVTGVTTPAVCPVGTFNNATAVRRVEDCLACTSGHYCASMGLHEPTGPCDPGYYCLEGSDTATPYDSMFPTTYVATPIGGRCPPGGYCPAGSSQPAPCPDGTFSNVTGASTPSGCLPCIPGSYCQGSSNPYPSGLCEAGFFCPEGSVSPKQNVTPAGYYTPEGSAVPLACPPGTYNPAEQQGACRDCLPGRFCNASATIVPALCTAGGYCPAGVSYPVPCPSGTFSNNLGLVNESSCTQCSPGQYCSRSGLTAPEGACDAGHVCGLGSSQINPPGSGVNGVCPAGGYCPAGSADVTLCPNGTFNAVTGGVDIAACAPCSPGSYCADRGLSSPSGLCAAGYYCAGGATTASPSDGTTGARCPAGTHCLPGSTSPTTCSPGTFQNVSGQSACANCTPRYYCDGSSPTTPEICPPGYYCPAGTAAQNAFPCPAGTFNNRTGLETAGECFPCTAGLACTATGLTQPNAVCSPGFVCSAGSLDTQGRTSVSGPTSPCPLGHYCPAGTAHGAQHACPIGTLRNSTGAQAEDDCLPCPAAEYCDVEGMVASAGLCAASHWCARGNSVSTPSSGSVLTFVGGATNATVRIGGDVCPVGHYCPAGTAQPVPCVAGTYASTPGAGANCTACPAGYWCPAGSVTYNNTPCAAGYYCPTGAAVDTDVPCPAGTFSNRTGLAASGECAPCLPGQYCGSPGLTAPSGDCAAGYFCAGGASTPAPVDGVTGDACVAGEYCPPGSASPLYCAAGYYCSDTSGNLTGLCAAGYYCKQGASVPTPTNQTNAQGSTGGPCPPGHYCPAGSGAPVPCNNGTYSSASGNIAKSDCQACTPGFYCPDPATSVPAQLCWAGYYCTGGATVPTQHLCPAGHFCGNGTATPQPCPAGTYASAPGSQSCAACPEGFVCAGATVTPADCPLGHYCEPGTQYGTQYPCPAGTFANTTNLRSAAECFNCTAGQYCGSPGLSSPSGPCTAGHYCVGGAASSQPTDGFDSGYVCSLGYTSIYGGVSPPATGDVCPTGHYCDQGAAHPAACPPGTMNPTFGGNSSAACVACTAGYFCPNSTTDGVDVLPRECSAGFYCPGGDVQPTLACPTGSFCPAGSTTPQPCTAGTYANTTGLATCLACPAGAYCTGGTIQPMPCPAGYYCPASTTGAMLFPCPAGTFRSSTGAQDAADCAACTPGSYCAVGGLTAPTGLCSAGSFCLAGSGAAAPVLGAQNGLGPSGTSLNVGDVCPAGHYCPAGTVTPTACSPGTVSPNTGAGSSASCVACPGGSECAVAGLAAPSAACPAGYYCPAGTVSATLLCPSGHYCDGGDAAPVQCAARTYMNETGGVGCRTCPAGYACPAGTVYPETCMAGHYCPASTAAVTELPCAAGTYNSLAGASDVAQCVPCTPGSFCAGVGNAAPDGLCGPGYFCSGGSSSPTPLAGATGGPCDAGYVCRYGSTSAQPAGGVWPSTAGQPGGDPGYPCPPGMYCPKGSTSPLGCQPGTFSGASGAATCSACPARKLCPGSTSVPETCPAGYYCPGGVAVPFTCPSGTHGVGMPGLASSFECASCPAGSFCTGGNVTGLCAAGYVCYSRALTATPASTDMPAGRPCPRGYFCPEGSKLEQPCTNGTFSATEGATSAGACGPCPPGFTCLDGNPTPIDCLPGHYCPGSGAEIACPARTYNPLAAQSNASACLPCPAGSYCTETGISNPNLYACPPGSYCPEATDDPLPCPEGRYNSLGGAATDLECPLCPGGHVCLAGTVAPEACDAGTFCPAGAVNATTCTAGSYCPPASITPVGCPAGYYCPTGSATPTICEQGTYCPANSVFPLVCPAGTFSPPASSGSSRTSAAEACTVCPAGYYSDATDGTQCSPCTKGYVCLGGTSSPRPLNEQRDKGYACPAGFYCPEGSAIERPCPRGTFNPSPGASVVGACLPCSLNSFNAEEGASACKPCSSSSYTNSTGSLACTCRGMYRHFQPTDGACICQPGYHALQSDGELVSETDGEEDCQPITFDWCDSGQTRTDLGQCATPDCAAQCPSGAGEIDPDLGLCVCTGELPADVVCDATCRANRPLLSVDPKDGRVLLYTADNVSAAVTLNLNEDIAGFTGNVQCLDGVERVRLEVAGANTTDAVPPTNITCQIHSVSTSADGFEGLFGVHANVLSAGTGSGSSARRMMSSLKSAAAEYATLRAAAAGTHDAAVSAQALLAAQATIRALALDVANSQLQGRLDVLESRALSSQHAARALAELNQRAALTVTEHAQRLVAALTQEPQPGSTASAGSWRALALSNATVAPTLPRPAACIHVGDSMMWSVTTTPAGEHVYPVYVKDSMLNSNPAFDYGSFRNLASLMRVPSLAASVNFFAHTFLQIGVFVFATSINVEDIMLVRVVDVGQECPSQLNGAVFVPTTAENMVALGVKESVEAQLEPNWSLLAALMAGLFLTMAVVVSALYFFRRLAWNDAGDASRKRYHALGDSKAAFRKKMAAAEAGEAGAGDSEEAAMRAEGGAGKKGRLAGGRAAMQDVEEMDEEDLRDLIARMRQHHDEVISEFESQRDGAQRILSTLREEADALRRMIADAAVEHGAESLAAGPGAAAARKAAALRQVEAELGARSLYERGLARREGEVLAALRRVADEMQSKPRAVAAGMVEQLADVGKDAADVASGLRALRDAQPADSRAVVQVRDAVASAQDIISGYVRAVQEERDRRKQGLDLWKSATDAGLSSSKDGQAVIKALEQLESDIGPVDAAVDTLLQQYNAYAAGAGQFNPALATVLITALQDIASARESQNPAIEARACATHSEQAGNLTEQLDKATAALLGRLPAIEQRLHAARAKADRAAERAMLPVRAVREAAEEEAADKGVARQGVATLAEKLASLIQSGGKLGDLRGGAGAGDSDEDEDADDAAAAAAFVADTEKAAASEAAALAERVEAAAAAEQAEAQKQAAAAERELQALLNDPALTEDERARIMAEFAKDQEAVAEAMESEKARQQRLLAARLDQRKAERLARKMRAAQAAQATKLAAEQESERERLEAAQAAERVELAARLEAELRAAVDAQLGDEGHADAIEADTTFDVENELRLARSKFDADSEAVRSNLAHASDAMGAELTSHVRQQRDGKIAALSAKHAAEIQAMAGDAAAIAQLIPRHVAEWRELQDTLREDEAHALSDETAQVDARAKKALADLEAVREALASRVQDLEASLADELNARKASARARVADEFRARAADVAREQAAELASAVLEDRPVLEAQHAAARSRLAALAEAEAAREVAAVEAAAAAATAQLEAAGIFLRGMPARESYEVDLAGAELKRDLQRALAAESLTREMLGARQLAEIELAEKHAQELASATTDAERAAMQARHAQEMLDLADKAAADAEAAAAAGEARMQRIDEDYTARAAALRREYERNQEAAQDAAMAEADRQKADLTRRLKDRAAKRKAAAHRRHLQEQQAAQDPQALRAVLEAQREELEQLEQAEQEADRQAATAADAVEKVLRGAFDAEAELRRVREAHEQDEQARESAAAAEAARQSASMRAKLRARKAKRMAQMRAQQAEELAAATQRGASQAEVQMLAEAHQAALSTVEAEEDASAETEAAQHDAEVAAKQQETKLRQMELSNESLERRLAEIRSAWDEDQEKLLGKVQGEERRQKSAMAAKLRKRQAAKAAKQRKEQAMERARMLQRQAQAAVSSAAAGPGQAAVAAMAEAEAFEEEVVSAVATAMAQQAAAAAGVAPDTGAAAGGVGAEPDSAEAMAAAAAAAAAEEERRLEEAAAAAELAALQELHAQERAAAKAAADAEAREEAKRVEAAARAKREAASEAKRREVEARLAAARSSTAEEFERVKAAAEAEMAAFETAQEEETRRQSAAMKKRLEARRARKARAMKRKQDEEVAVKAAEQQRQAAEREAKAAQEREKAALAAILEAGQADRARAGDAVEAVLAERHARETADLLAAQYSERSSAMRRELENVLDGKREERDDTVVRMKEAGADDDAIDAALADLDEKWRVKQRQTEERVLEQLEVGHAKQQLMLRERQLEELAGTLAELAPDDVLRRREAEEAAAEAVKLRQFQEELQAQQAERVAAAQAEAEAAETAMKAEAEAELKRLEEEHAASMAEARAKQEAAMEKRREQLRVQQEEARRRALEEAATLDEETREKLLAELDANTAALEDKLERERARQNASLKKRLEARKLKARRAKEAEMAQRMAEQAAKQRAQAEAQAAEDRRRKEAAEKAAKAQAAAKVSAAAPAKLAKAVAKEQVEVAAKAKGETELSAETAAALPSAMNSMVGRLEAIESLLVKLAAGAPAALPAAVAGPDEAAAGGAAAAPAATAAWEDPSSAAQPTEGTLRAVAPEELHSREKLRLELAQRIANAAAAAGGLSQVQVAVASALPHNEYVGNAYRNVVHYDVLGRKLYIRRERFGQAGDIALVTSHALAHARVHGAAMAPDSDPKFVAEFHRIMRIAGGESFKQQQASTLAAHAAPARAAVRAGADVAADDEALEESGSSIRERFQNGVRKLNMMQSLGNVGQAGDAADAGAGAAAAAPVQPGGGDDEDLEVLATSRLHRGQWEAGSLNDRLSSVAKLGARAELAKYLAELEGDVLGLGEATGLAGKTLPDEDLPEGSPFHVRRESTAVVDAAAAAARAEQDPEGHLAALRVQAQNVQDRLDSADAAYLEKVKLVNLAQERLAELHQLENELLEELQAAEQGSTDPDARSAAAITTELESARAAIANDEVVLKSKQAAVDAWANRIGTMKAKLEAANKAAREFEAMPRDEQLATMERSRSAVLARTRRDSVSLPRPQPRK